jgi:hypothetical protein
MNTITQIMFAYTLKNKQKMHIPTTHLKKLCIVCLSQFAFLSGDLILNFTIIIYPLEVCAFYYIMLLFQIGFIEWV